MCDSVTSTVISSSNATNTLQSCWIVYTNNQGTEGLTVTRCTNAPMDSVNRINSSITFNNPAPPSRVNDGAEDVDRTTETVDLREGVTDGERNSTKQKEHIDSDTLYSILDPKLRPLTPVPNNPLSNKIHAEHKDLVQTYFEFEYHIVTSMAQRDTLQKNMTSEELQLKKAYIKRFEEKEALKKFKDNLQKQLNEKKMQLQARQQQQQVSLHPPPLNRQESDSGWVIIPENHN